MATWVAPYPPRPRSRSRSPYRAPAPGYDYRADWDAYERDRAWASYERERAVYDYGRRGRSRSPSVDEGECVWDLEAARLMCVLGRSGAEAKAVAFAL